MWQVVAFIGAIIIVGLIIRLSEVYREVLSPLSNKEMLQLYADRAAERMIADGLDPTRIEDIDEFYRKLTFTDSPDPFLDHYCTRVYGQPFDPFNTQHLLAICEQSYPAYQQAHYLMQRERRTQ